MDFAIETRALGKVYASGQPRRGRGQPGGGRTDPTAGAPSDRVAGRPAPPPSISALVDLDLTVARGELFGLLGPNGAGKTTTLGILTTRVRPTAGWARVEGVDVVTGAVAVRACIGVVPQRANPDRGLSVIENLIFHAAYFGFARSASRAHAGALLERMGLGARADARVDQLSGGQQQRLMIARALIHRPHVLFLDEPTVGLDPQARLALWEILRGVHAEGRTIVMTTHYMEEAEQLCDRVAIIDRGRLLACDAPAALRRRAPGGTLIEIALDAPAGDAAMAAARVVPGITAVTEEGPVVRAYHPDGGEAVAPLIGLLQEAGRRITNIRLVPPSLETLFVSLTGRKLD